MTERSEIPAEYRQLVPASPVVAHHINSLLPDMYLRDSAVLDVGCGRGRNSIQMFVRGYRDILGIDTDPDMLEEARERSAVQARKVSRKAGAAACEFVELDMRQVSSIDKDFSVVMANEVLHTLPKPEQYDLLRDLQAKTRPRGQHLVSGYLLTPDVQDPRNRAQMLNPGELQRFYKSTGWDVTFTRDQTRKPTVLNGVEQVWSQTHVIARNRAQR